MANEYTDKEMLDWLEKHFQSFPFPYFGKIIWNGNFALRENVKIKNFRQAITAAMKESEGNNDLG